MGYGRKTKDEMNPGVYQYHIQNYSCLSLDGWVLSFWRSRVSGITFILHQVEFAQLNHTKYIPILAGASSKGVETK